MTVAHAHGEPRAGPGRPADPDEDFFAVPGLAMLELDEDGIITAASSAFCELVGRPGAELRGRTPADFTHPDDVSASLQSVVVVRDGPVNCSKRYLRPDGTVVPVHLSAIWLPARRRVLGHVADLRTLVAEQDAVQRARARLVALVEHSSDLIFVIDRHGRLVEANPAVVQLVGDRIGEPARAIMQEHVHPDDLTTVLDALAEVYTRAGPHPSVTFRLVGVDGHWVTLDASANNQCADPDVLGVVVNARDISRAVEQQEQAGAMMRAMLGALVRTTEWRDPYTAGHQLNVADLALRIAQQLGLADADCGLIELGASVHDIGKIAVPAEILTRPGRLSALEFEMIKTHCRVGFDILTDAGLPEQITDIVLHHHERLDGSGYPDNLAGDSISLPARIVAVADVIDAMASHRPYRPALGFAAARAEIERGRGLQYDPDVADAALSIVSARE